MGGFPSSDAPPFIYTTAVQLPAGGTGTLELCLIPLTRTYFNDHTNQKVKDAVLKKFFNAPNDCVRLALQAIKEEKRAQGSRNSSHPTSPATAAPAPAAASADATTAAAAASPEEERRARALQAYRAFSQLLTDVELVSAQSAKSLMAALGDALPATVRRVQEERLAKVGAAYSDREVIAVCGEEAYKNWAAGKTPATDADTASAAAAAAAAGTTSPPAAASDKADGPPSHTASPAPSGTAAPASASAASAATAPSGRALFRPLPCVVCIVESDQAKRKGGAGGHLAAVGAEPSTSRAAADAVNMTGLSLDPNTGGQTTSVWNGAHCNVPSVARVMVNRLLHTARTAEDWAPINSRRVHCIGYISCFHETTAALQRYYDDAGAPPPAAPAAPVSPLGSTAPGLSASAAARERDRQRNSRRQVRLGPCAPGGTDVLLDLRLDHEDQQYFLLEPIVFLASMTFRSQFLSTCMSYQVPNSAIVEEAYYRHLQLLNLRVRIPAAHYHHLKAFADQYPLAWIVDELGINERCYEHVLLAQAASARGESTIPIFDKEDATAQERGGRSAGASTDGVAGAASAGDSTAADRGADSAADEAACRHDSIDDKDDDKDDDDELPAGAAEGEEGRRKGKRGKRRKHYKKARHTGKEEEVYRLQACFRPRLSVYETDSGEFGVEAVMSGDLLARFMKYVTEVAAYETVKGSYVRCDLGPLMKERRHLCQFYKELQNPSEKHSRNRAVATSAASASASTAAAPEASAASGEREEPEEQQQPRSSGDSDGRPAALGPHVEEDDEGGAPSGEERKAGEAAAASNEASANDNPLQLSLTSAAGASTGAAAAGGAGLQLPPRSFGRNAVVDECVRAWLRRGQAELEARLAAVFVEEEKRVMARLQEKAKQAAAAAVAAVSASGANAAAAAATAGTTPATTASAGSAATGAMPTAAASGAAAGAAQQQPQHKQPTITIGAVPAAGRAGATPPQQQQQPQAFTVQQAGANGGKGVQVVQQLQFYPQQQQPYIALAPGAAGTASAQPQPMLFRDPQTGMLMYAYPAGGYPQLAPQAIPQQQQQQQQQQQHAGMVAAAPGMYAAAPQPMYYAPYPGAAAGAPMMMAPSAYPGIPQSAFLVQPGMQPMMAAPQAIPYAAAPGQAAPAGVQYVQAMAPGMAPQLMQFQPQAQQAAATATTATTTAANGSNVSVTANLSQFLANNRAAQQKAAQAPAATAANGTANSPNKASGANNNNQHGSSAASSVRRGGDSHAGTKTANTPVMGAHGHPTVQLPHVAMAPSAAAVTVGKPAADATAAVASGVAPSHQQQQQQGLKYPSSAPFANESAAGAAGAHNSDEEDDNIDFTFDFRDDDDDDGGNY